MFLICNELFAKHMWPLQKKGDSLQLDLESMPEFERRQVEKALLYMLPFVFEKSTNRL